MFLNHSLVVLVRLNNASRFSVSYIFLRKQIKFFLFSFRGLFISPNFWGKNPRSGGFRKTQVTTRFEKPPSNLFFWLFLNEAKSWVSFFVFVSNRSGTPAPARTATSSPEFFVTLISSRHLGQHPTYSWVRCWGYPELDCRWKDPALLLWLRLEAEDPRL